MINILKGFGLLLCGIIPQGLQDFVVIMAELLWEFLRFICSIVLSLVALLFLTALVCGFAYSIFAAPLIAIAICAVVIMIKVVFR